MTDDKHVPFRFSPLAPRLCFWVLVQLITVLAGVARSASIGPALRLDTNGSNVVVSFSGALQSAPSPEGPFATVQGAMSPQTFQMGADTGRFWRARIGSAQTFAGGWNHTAAIASNGTLWTWGDNAHGQLGVSGIPSGTPMRVGTGSNWLSVACGGYHTLALQGDGTLWAWGSNTYGQLGNPLAGTNSLPVRVGGDSNWVAIACNGEYSMATKADGSLWGWGLNSAGQLGNGTFTNAFEPTRVGTDNDWLFASCGEDHVAALKNNGSLWAFGRNDKGQLGNSTFADMSEPTRVVSTNDWVAVACGNRCTVAIKSDGTLWTWGDLNIDWRGDNAVATNLPVLVSADRDWITVACGGYHVTLVKADGSLWGWGNGGGGELGGQLGRQVPYTSLVRLELATDWTDVACGQGWTLALKSDGSLWTWGRNDFSQLGNGSLYETNRLARIGIETNWVAAAAGYQSTAAFKSDGSLWLQGVRYGQIGLSEHTNQPTRLDDASWRRIAFGAFHTVAIRTDGSLWAWGSDSRGQLGLGNGNSASRPVQVGSDFDWQDVASGFEHNLAVKGSGTLWAWGGNGSGQLGTGSNNRTNVPTQVGVETNWAAVACGSSHSSGLRTDGTLWMWGNANYGQLGIGLYGFDARTNTPVQVGTNRWKVVAAGSGHTAGIQIDGSLWSWGANFSGELGNGDTPNFIYIRPSQVGIENNWDTVSCGRSHTAGLKFDGTLWTCGDNIFGQIGTGSFPKTNRFVRVGMENQWTGVSCGEWHTVAVAKDGSLWGCGKNDYGEIGQPVRWLGYPVLGARVWQGTP